MGLQNAIGISGNVEKNAKELKAEYNLTDYEALSLALKAEQNELIQRGLVISGADSYPAGLEAIAIALGFENQRR
jgi:hypothetical protein